RGAPGLLVERRGHGSARAALARAAPAARLRLLAQRLRPGRRLSDGRDPVQHRAPGDAQAGEGKERAARRARAVAGAGARARAYVPRAARPRLLPDEPRDPARARGRGGEDRRARALRGRDARLATVAICPYPDTD